MKVSTTREKAAECGARMSVHGSCHGNAAVNLLCNAAASGFLFSLNFAWFTPTVFPK